LLPACSWAPFGLGADAPGKAMAAVNVRSRNGAEPATLKFMPFDDGSL
jgi:hypothetical protein